MASLTVLHRLVGDGELSQVMTHHLRLDLDLTESLPVVDTNDRADHLGNNNHMAEVSLDDGGLLAYSQILAGLTALSQNVLVLSLVRTTSDLSAETSREEFHELLLRDVEQLLELDALVREGPERTPFLGLRHAAEDLGPKSWFYDNRFVSNKKQLRGVDRVKAH